jgi:hypothetical protein
MALSSETPSEIVRADLQRQALDLRVAGMTFEAIGRALGMSPLRASTLISEKLREVNRESGETAEQMRDIVALRLDNALSRIAIHAFPRGHEEIVGDDGKRQRVPKAPNLPYVETYLSIIDRQVKLFGLSSADQANARLEAEMTALVRQIVSAASALMTPESVALFMGKIGSIKPELIEPPVDVEFEEPSDGV